MKHRRTLVVVMDRSLTCHREILRGISGYIRAEGDWHLEIFSAADNYVDLTREANPEGVIVGWVADPVAAAQVCQIVPSAIGCCGQHERLNLTQLPQVESDDEAVGELAAHYFIRKGYRSFAFVGLQTIWSRRRLTGFERIIRQHGCNLAIQAPEQSSTTTLWGWARPHNTDDLVDWLRGLPKPLAVLSCNDPRGHDVIEACRTASLRVPEDVAILGVDNDDLDCELTNPPLSSVAVPWRRIGSEAAARLMQMIQEKTRATGIHFVPPIGVIERQSTDTVAISDADLSAALRYIRDHAADAIGVEDILKNVPISRRAMEVSFRKHLGRSPLEEIRRVRVEIAKQLLAGSDLAISTIAERSGFNNAARFSKVFHDVVGSPPSEYRGRFRT